MKKIIRHGEEFSKTHVFNKEKHLYPYLALSGDNNNIHTDEHAASACPIGRIAVPAGLVFISIVSNVIGTTFPGHGTIYKEHQKTRYLRPIDYDVEYIALFKITKVFPKQKNRAFLSVSINSLLTGKRAYEYEFDILNNEVEFTD